MAKSKRASEPRRPSDPRARAIVCTFVIAAITILAFAPAFTASWVTWDDDKNFLEHDAWRGVSPSHLRWMFTTFHMGPYQPLAWVTLGMDHELFGLDPRGYHVTSVLLHVATAIAFFLLARELMRRPSAVTQDGSTFNPPSARVDVAATFAALVFAAHPLRVESVAWITERRDVLSGLFLVLSVLAYVRSVRATDGTARRAFVGAIVLYAASLLSKGLGMTLPLALIVLDATCLGRWNGKLAAASPSSNDANAGGVRGASLLALAREKTPFFALAIAAAVVAWIGQSRVPGAMLGVERHGPLERIAQSFYGLWFYASRTLWPADLSPLVPLPQPFDALEPRFVIAIVVVIAIGVLAFLARRRFPAVVGAWIAYALFLLPVLGLVQTGPQLVADRYSYLGCMPLALLAGAALYAALPGIAVFVAAGCVAALASVCYRQTKFWQSTTALFTRACEVEPRNPLARRNLVDAYLEAAQTAPNKDEALAQYQHAIDHCALGIASSPDPTMLSRAAFAFGAVAELRPDHKREFLDLAIDHARRAVELGERMGEPVPETYRSLGTLLCREDRYAEAIPSFEWLAQHEPNDGNQALMLGQALARAGRANDALAPLQRATELEPAAPLPWIEIGDVQRKLGNTAAARDAYRRGVELGENDVQSTAREELASWKATLAELEK